MFGIDATSLVYVIGAAVVLAGILSGRYGSTYNRAS